MNRFVVLLMTASALRASGADGQVGETGSGPRPVRVQAWKPREFRFVTVYIHEIWPEFMNDTDAGNEPESFALQCMAYLLLRGPAFKPHLFAGPLHYWTHRFVRRIATKPSQRRYPGVLDEIERLVGVGVFPPAARPMLAFFEHAEERELSVWGTYRLDGRRIAVFGAWGANRVHDLVAFIEGTREEAESLAAGVDGPQRTWLQTRCTYMSAPKEEAVVYDGTIQVLWPPSAVLEAANEIPKTPGAFPPETRRSVPVQDPAPEPPRVASRPSPGVAEERKLEEVVTTTGSAKSTWPHLVLGLVGGVVAVGVGALLVFRRKRA